MKLVGPESLTKNYSNNDVLEIVAVTVSTVDSSPSATLRYSKVKKTDLREWKQREVASSLQKEIQIKRISSMHGLVDLPAEEHYEHLVVRDLDLDHLEPDKRGSVPGRVVAHAEYRFLPSFSCQEEEEDSASPDVPAGFGKELQTLLNNMVEKTLQDLFGGLPCFELHVIATLTPSHLRKGIAKKLVEWVFPFADHFTLPVVLSASPMGLPLYRKCGFEEYRDYDVIVDLTSFGGEGIHRHVFMVRWPKDTEKLSTYWKDWRSKHKAGSSDMAFK